MTAIANRSDGRFGGSRWRQVAALAVAVGSRQRPRLPLLPSRPLRVAVEAEVEVAARAGDPDHDRVHRVTRGRKGPAGPSPERTAGRFARGGRKRLAKLGHQIQRRARIRMYRTRRLWRTRARMTFQTSSRVPTTSTCRSTKRMATSLDGESGALKLAGKKRLATPRLRRHLRLRSPHHLPHHKVLRSSDGLNEPQSVGVGAHR